MTKTSDQSAASHPSGPKADAGAKKATRIVDAAREEAGGVAGQARHDGVSAVQSMSAFVAARPLAWAAAVFGLGLVLGRRRSR